MAKLAAKKKPTYMGTAGAWSNPKAYTKAATSRAKKPTYMGTAGAWSNPKAFTQAASKKGYSTQTRGAQPQIYRPPTSSGTTLPQWSGDGGGGGGGGGYDAAAVAAASAAAAKRTADKKAADATKRSVDALHGQLAALDKSKNQSIANIDKRLKEGRALIDTAFQSLSGALLGSQADNEKSEHDQTYVNLANRGRERADILAETALQGAGETDVLKTQAMALRNWAANQAEVNRAYHDTQRSINTEKTSLNSNTKQNLHNLYAQANVDKTAVFDDYYKGQADVWNQIFNIENSMHDNDQYKVAYKDADKKAQTAIGSKYKDPGTPNEIKNWSGMEVTEKQLNNSQFGLQDYGTSQQMKKPEGATLRKW